MCFKKWFHKPDPPTPPDPLPVTNRALLFAINNYPASGNDLNGCLNDQADVANKLNAVFPTFEIKKFSDAEVTVARFKSELAYAIKAITPGTTVIILLDSCFSGTATRNVTDPALKIKSKFVQPILPIRPVVGKKLFKSADDINWIVISGCGEHQTSADAYINGRYNGAFTYYALKALKEGQTYQEWFTEITKYLPGNGFEQAPELEGLSGLLNRKVFVEPTLLIHYSGHGSYTYDANGDEEDGRDEALYLYDDMLVDDEINEILKTIPLFT
jgi:hypothetical protein